jgi:hypothetical protein
MKNTHAKKAGDLLSQPAHTHKNDITDTSTRSQQLRLLNALRASPNGITTIQARADLNILHPSGRIQELKRRGYQIETIPVTIEDDYGRKHRAIARYVLLSESEAAHG